MRIWKRIVKVILSKLSDLVDANSVRRPFVWLFDEIKALCFSFGCEVVELIFHSQLSIEHQIVGPASASANRVPQSCRKRELSVGFLLASGISYAASFCDARKSILVLNYCEKV